ncbi:MULTISPECIES: T9SS type A sorting domain-containing protein [Chitinophagaceae]
MKRKLLLFLLFCGIMEAGSASFTYDAANVTATTTQGSTAYRWRYDNGTLAKPASSTTASTVPGPVAGGASWATNESSPVVVAGIIKQGTTYRLRAGSGVTVSATYLNSGTTYNVNFNTITVQSVDNASVQYKLSTEAVTAYRSPGTNGATTEAVYAQGSSYVSNSAKIGTDATNQLLSTTTSSTYYMGGNFYSTLPTVANPISVTTGRTLPYTFNIGTGATGTTSVYIPFELEVGMSPSGHIVAGATYDCQISFRVGWYGTGSVYAGILYGTYGPYRYPASGYKYTTITMTSHITVPSTLVLPIQWGDFTVTKMNNQAALRWNTVMETNNKGFDVLRSTDAKDYTKVGFVSSKAVNGNSSTPIDYDFTDKNPASGTNYYKLNQIDQDGKVNASDVRTISFTNEASAVAVIPNPVVSDFKLSNAKVGASYRIVNMSGQILQYGIVSSSSQQFSIPYYPAGMYIIQTQDAASGQNISVKFMKR